MADQVRVDKWLWAVRVFKTRSAATEACRKGHVTISELPAKPSREISVGSVVKVRKSPVVHSFKVLALAEKRMSAKLVENFATDVTPKEELEILEVQKNMLWFNREKGTGRPTKKDRRDIDRFID